MPHRLPASGGHDAELPGRLALAIMAGEDDPADMQWTLHWLRHRWPGCPITVVSNAGGLENEMVARQGGAFYLTSDEASLLLPHMISHALRVKAGSAFPLSPVTH